MPELSRFFGLIIKIQYRDHAPPHVHVWYGGKDRACLKIESGDIYRGSLPKAHLRMVQAWMYIHQHELQIAWDMVMRRIHPDEIAPLR